MKKFITGLPVGAFVLVGSAGAIAGNKPKGTKKLTSAEGKSGIQS